MHSTLHRHKALIFQRMRGKLLIRNDIPVTLVGGVRTERGDEFNSVFVPPSDTFDYALPLTEQVFLQQAFAAKIQRKNMERIQVIGPLIIRGHSGQSFSTAYF